MVATNSTAKAKGVWAEAKADHPVTEALALFAFLCPLTLGAMAFYAWCRDKRWRDAERRSRLNALALGLMRSHDRST